MTYNPSKHHRHSIRLKYYDYSKSGLYFITICCQDRIHRFGDVHNGEMILNNLGLVAFNEIVKLTERFSNVDLDIFQIMPNHIHVIFVLNEFVGAGFTPAQNIITPAPNNINHVTTANVATTPKNINHGATARVAPTVSGIVGTYKSLVFNECLKIFKIKNEIMGKFWQRNYYEHIIRDHQSYMRISEYIINNPANWTKDSLNNKLFIQNTDTIHNQD